MTLIPYALQTSVLSLVANIAVRTDPYHRHIFTSTAKNYGFG